MENPYQLGLRNDAAGALFRRWRGNANFEVLVTLGQGVEVKSVSGIGEEDLRPYFGVNCLGVDVGEGDAENERTQIVDIGDTAERPEGALGQETGILAPLVLRWIADAAVRDSLIVKVDVGAVAGTSAKFSALKPAPLGIVFRAERGVRAAIQDPVHGVAGHPSFRG